MPKFTFEFSDEADRQMDKIMEIEGLENRASVLKKALTLLFFITEEKEKGAKMFIENKKLNTRKEITEF